MALLDDDNAIEAITANRQAHYEPMGWHHWPEHPWLSYQFRRGLGETQEGGGAVSEVFLAASRMIPGDLESWHAEWERIGDFNWTRGHEEEAKGHIRTAMNCFLRAADYYRQAEFHLEPKDPRRLPTFERMEACSHKFLQYLNPPGEVVDIPYENGVSLCGYFVRAPFPGDKMPVLICMGGLDSIKDEMWFMQAHGCLQRGISVLMVDMPGQGGTLRRHGVVNRVDTEVPVGKCIDWLVARDDVDPSRIAVCGSSLGGYYAARAGCYEPRLAACISHGAIWSITDIWGGKGEDFGLAMHIKWVFGTPTMKAAMEKAEPFTLEGHLDHMRCPYLVLHGGHDVLTVSASRKTYDYAIAKGVNATLRLTDENETGAEHCQHDNPTIGQEILADWLADVFKIDQRALLKTGWNNLIEGRAMNLGIDVIRPAIVAIDCHRGHLDPSVATMPAAPETAARLVAANKALFDAARPLGVPVIHLVTTYRDVAEIRANPFWRTRAEDPNATRKNVLRHNLAGSPGCTIMPGLHQAGDMIVDTKKRYDCFQGTDLDITLRTHGVNTLLITGINTNSCVLATACAANVRDYAVIVVEDCVDTMDTPDHHAAALLCLRTAFGHVMSSADALALVGTKA